MRKHIAKKIYDCVETRQMWASPPEEAKDGHPPGPRDRNQSRVLPPASPVDDSTPLVGPPSFSPPKDDSPLANLYMRDTFVQEAPGMNSNRLVPKPTDDIRRPFPVSDNVLAPVGEWVMGY